MVNDLNNNLQKKDQMEDKSTEGKMLNFLVHREVEIEIQVQT